MPNEPTHVQAVCAGCYRLHLVRDLVLIDGEPTGCVCPDCGGRTRPVPQPAGSELSRLFPVEAAARAWHSAHRAEEAARIGDQYAKARLLPPGEPGLALTRLAMLLAE